MLESYFTVKSFGEDEQVIQKSRFIGYVKRVESEEEAKAFIQEIKKKHADANHNCSAYMIGEHDQIQKANDDGEPSGTAGVPILEVLKKRELKDTVVVITRYFGGVKLGAGGLIRAYASTTTLALNTTGIVNRILMKEFKITADYSLLGKLENALIQSPYLLEKIDYLEQVTLYVFAENNQQEIFYNWVIDISSDQVKVMEGELLYMEIAA
ncbi:YigZ family protein [Saliterribacillus persicus]|uniref:Putative YigZ family protein n=1 Tax=Saliterribacillus persicus TaxID=930114 RepID=A0A368Y7E6_9BACI|nr:YigZ family protein [Saliterribacillus persicus]RCW74737.1 putative YigZ family protein [Saliterribacillus persicus]